MNVPRALSGCDRCRELAGALRRERRARERAEARYRRLADRIRADAAGARPDPDALDLGWALDLLSSEDRS